MSRHLKKQEERKRSMNKDCSKITKLKLFIIGLTLLSYANQRLAYDRILQARFKITFKKRSTREYYSG